MCELCSGDPKERQLAKESAVAFAERLEEAAALYRLQASGRMEPHGPEVKRFREGPARYIIRRLVEEWV